MNTTFNAGLVGNSDNPLIQIIEAYPAFHITGCLDPDSSKTLQNRVTGKRPGPLSREKLFELNSVIIFLDSGPDIMDLITEALKRSMHIMLFNPGALRSWELAELIKLREEAQATVFARYFERYGPVLQACKRLIGRPALLNIRLMVPQSKSHTEQEAIAVNNNVLRMLDALLFLSPSNIKKIRSLRQPFGSTAAGLVSSRIEFDNGTVANLLFSDISEKESFTIDIYNNNMVVSADITGAKLTRMKRAGENGLTAKKEKFSKGNNQSVYDELERFHQAINGNRDSGNDLFEIFRMTELISKITEKAAFF